MSDSGPFSVYSVDINGDNKLDLITANSGSNNISVLLGIGTGSFGIATNFATGLDSRSVISADFNGDGETDLAVGNNGSANASVLLGTGTGNFGSASNFATNTQCHSICKADFDGDGTIDLATANYGASNVSILVSTGTGSFVATLNFTVDAGPSSVISADFNGDGKADLATANYDSDDVSILLNTSPLCNGCSSIEQMEENIDQTKVYPNPNSGNFILETTERKTIRVFDVDGKIVLNQNIDGKANINIESLNGGVYSLIIIDAEGVRNKKLIIMK
jgi:hypothetical protein